MLKDLNHITLSVSDLEKSLQFYRDVLGFTAHVMWDKGAYFSLGEKNNSSEGDSLYFLDLDKNRLEIHAGSLQSRLKSLAKEPYKGLQWLTHRGDRDL